MEKQTLKYKIKVVAAAFCFAVFLSGFVYGCIVFMTLNLNPVEWDYDSKAAMVSLGFVVSMLVFIMIVGDRLLNSKQ